jgi:hypothetical protein
MSVVAEGVSLMLAHCASLRGRPRPSGRRPVVFNKKLLFTALVAVVGYLGYKRVQADKAEQDLWAEATDPVAPRDRQ